MRTNLYERIDHFIALLSLEDHPRRYRTAWTNGKTTIKDILSGRLPRDLAPVLGLVEIASATRYITMDSKSSVTAEEKFLNDLDRWRTLLQEDMHPAYDHIVHVLWGKEYREANNWMDKTDAQEKLRYFQDLAHELLSRASTLRLNLPDIDQPESNMFGGEHMFEGLHYTPSNGTSFAEYEAPTSNPTCRIVMLMAGAIFGFVIVFLLLCMSSFIYLLLALTPKLYSCRILYTLR